MRVPLTVQQTVLQVELMPYQTLAAKNELCKSGNKPKERVTVTCNTSGTEKLKPLVIGKSMKPCCIKNVVSGV